MSKFKKLAVCGLAGVMVLGVGASLTACGGGAGGRKTLMVSTMFANGDTHEAVYFRYKNQFTNKNDDVYVKDSSDNPTGTDWEKNLVRDIKAGGKVTPDVIYYFSGTATDAIKDKLVTVAEIKAYDATYGANITNKDANPYSLGIKSGGLGIMYNAKLAPKTTFDSWANMEAFYGAGGADKDKLVASNSLTLPHYFFSPIMADELGLDAFEAFDGTKVQFTDATTNNLAEKKLSKTVFNKAVFNTLIRMQKMGFKSSVADNGPDYYAGTAAYYADGNWAIKNIDELTSKNVEDGKAPFEASVSAYPAVKKTAGGTETEKFICGGITNGWMITKKGWENEATRKLAIEFIKTQTTDAALNDYSVAGGGLPTNGKPLTGAKNGMTLLSKALEGITRSVMALDDRMPTAAKAATLNTWTVDSGIPMLLKDQNLTQAKVDALMGTGFYPNLA